MKHIYFEYRNNSPIIVSDKLYEAILALVELERLCSKCGCRFTAENPMVLLNLCLTCFLKQDDHKHFTFVGETREAAGERYYAFMDTDGMVHSTSTKSEQVTRDIYATLKFWNFPVPETHQKKGKEYTLYPFHWKMYGDVRAPAVVIENSSQYGDDPTVAYLVDKLGNILELNKRKKHIRQMFIEAHYQLEKCKRPDGLYVLPSGHERYWIGQADQYECIAAQAAGNLETKQAS